MKNCFLLIKKIISKANILASQKYSVNIIDKALELFEENDKNRLIAKLCDMKNILFLLDNQYGNYVLYKIINCMQNEMKIELIINCECKLKNAEIDDIVKLNKLIFYLKINNEHYINTK